MYCVGLTGSVGSGKSTALAYFKTLDIETISADDVAKDLTQQGHEAYTAIVQHFGQDILTPDGTLNRRQLRARILTDAAAKQWLEDLLHPLIRTSIEKTIALCHGPYVVIEIPLLYDRKAYPYLQHVLLIEANAELQIKRLIERDHCTPSDASALLTTQSNHHKRAHPDAVIHNTRTRAVFYDALKKMHFKYLKESIRFNISQN